LSYDASKIEVPDTGARMADQTELLHGTLDTLILKTLSWGPRHGYGVARWIQEPSPISSASSVVSWIQRATP